MPERGEIWLVERPNRKPRPYLVLTRSEAIPVLTRILAAPLTRTIRGIATEVEVGPEEGLRTSSAVSLDNLTPIRRSFMVHRIGAISPVRWRDVCEAMGAAVDC